MAGTEGTVDTEFTYSVKWRETETPFDKRMDKYRKYQFLPQHLEVSLCGFHCRLGPSLMPLHDHGTAGHMEMFDSKEFADLCLVIPPALL